MTLPPVTDRWECERRLRLIFPREAYDTVLSSPIAAAAVAAMLYVGAVVDEDGPLTGASAVVRPSTCLWMQEDVLARRRSDAERTAWFAASRSRKALDALVTGWGLTFSPWYGDNSRETLRDEALHGLRRYGAVRARTDVPTTSSVPRWALAAQFAGLFDPELSDAELAVVTEAWRATHLSAGEQLRIQNLNRRHAAAHAVDVTLPDGTVRRLEPGSASLILRGVVEEWASRRLREPVVLTISEPGAKVYTTDAAVLASLGVTIGVSDLLPDAVLVDVGVSPVQFWVVEAVATDGPVTAERKLALQAWAQDQRIDPSHLRFLSAFLSRSDAAARRRLKDLASGTYAWFLDEPDHELSWEEISAPPPARDVPPGER